MDSWANPSQNGNPNGILIGPAILAEPTVVTDQHRDYVGQSAALA